MGSSTEWFVRDGSGVSVHIEEPGVLLVHDKNDPPDWIMIPHESPEGGGRRLKVIGSFKRVCPKCRNAALVMHFLLEDKYGVAQCKPGCGYVFYRMPE